MSKLLKLAIACSLPLAAMATPTATAVWRSNLGQSYTIGGNTYAFAVGGGTLNGDGTITAPASFTSNLPYIDLEGKGVQAISVLVKYSGLDIAQVYSADTDAIGVGFASILDSDNNVVGTCVQKSETTNPLRAYYAGSGDSSAQPLDIGSSTVVEGTGYLLFSYQHDSGSRAYMGTTIAALAGGQNTSGKYSNRTLKKLAIGGDASGKAWNGAGFKIEEVAVFVGSYLTNEDVADYVFPTVTVDPAITTMSALNTKVAALDNEFLYFTSAASVSLDAEPESATQTFLQSDNWKGTVLIKDGEKLNIDPTIYGNPNSTLKLSGASGYFAKAQYTSAVTPQIELENSATDGKEYGFKQTNGYSFNSNGGYSYVNTPKLKGSGTLWGAWNGRAFYVVDDYSEFTGVLKLDTGDVVWLGASLPATVSDVESEVIQKGIRLGGAIPANVASWTADRYDGTVRLTTAISNEDAYKGDFLQNGKWKGTCQLDWNPGTGAFDIVNYGNANSVIEIATNFGPYPTRNGGANSANVSGEVKITEGVTWTISNGWDNQTTTFAKLSGGGTLTVNGTTSSSTAIPYTITTLEGFTGTLAGARGKFTIGRIVSSVEPTPGTKLVNCTTTYEPVLTNTEVYYNNAEVEDVELEFKAGDGIYVKAVAYVVLQPDSATGTNYYTTVSNAIVAASAGNKVVYLVATPDAADKYNISVGETVRIAKGGFEYDGIVSPQGAEYNYQERVVGGITMYSCALYTAIITKPDSTQEASSAPIATLLQGIYTDYASYGAGTTICVLDNTPEISHVAYDYNSETHTYTLKAMVATSTDGVSTTYYPSLAYAVQTVASGATITLIANDNVSFSDSNLEIGINKELTIDGGGFTVYGVSDYAGASDHDIYISGSSDITIKNVTLADFGGAVSVSGRTYPIWTGSAYSGTLTLDNVNVWNFNRTAFNLNGGTVVVTNCTIIGDTTKEAYFQEGIGVYNANVTIVDTAISNVGSNLAKEDSQIAACIQLGNPNGPAVGTGSITVVNGTYSGEYGIIVASNAQNTVSVQGGTFVGGLMVEEGEGGNIAVSGGTFDAAVPAEYLASGLEAHDNGKGQYVVQEDKGWICAEVGYWNHTGTWSGVEPAGEKVAIETNASYLADTPSAGQIVTVEMTLSFDDTNDDVDGLEDAKSAVRLAAGETDGTYQFQLYTSDGANRVWTNATVDVTANKEVDYAFVFVLDLTNKTYTASIVSGTTTNAMTVGGVTNIMFACQDNVTAVQRIDFVGSGTVTSIKGSYETPIPPEPEGFTPDEDVTINGGSVKLTDGQATWLNACSGSKAERDAALSGLDGKAFNNAYLLNLNVTDPAYDGTFTFEVTDFTVGDTTVSVEVSLTRNGELEGPINGTLKLTGTDELGHAFEVKDLATISDSHFSSGDGTTTISFTKDVNTRFFKPVIE